jgi:tocopherol O-methyltransferase
MARFAVRAAHRSVVPRYYVGKTADILSKYGPGPRVHFHTGPVTLPAQGSLVATAATKDEVRTMLVTAQEDLLDQTTTAWLDASGTPPMTLLDVGAGLGGTALYWAQNHNTRVTALTITREHVPLIGRFAAEAGVENQVCPVLGDAQDPYGWAGDTLWDAAVAIESSGYMRRGRLFTAMARVVRLDGWFGLVEHFPRDQAVTGLLDGHYKTRLGTMTEYRNAAAATGWRLVDTLDFTPGLVGFWRVSAEWTRRALADAGDEDREKLVRSQAMHRRFVDWWGSRLVETKALLFVRAPTGGGT